MTVAATQIHALRRAADRVPQPAWAAFLFAVLVVGYLWPALYGGRVLSPNSVLYTFPPGGAVAPADLKDHLNPLLSDPARQFYPWAVFAHHAVHAGVFPAWNPYVLDGTPFFANAQTALLSPFTLPLLVLPVGLGLGVSGALKLWVAAFGMYLLVRELRLGFWPAVVAGLSFSLCAFNVVWLSHPHTNVAVLLPAVVWRAERTLRERRAGAVLALSVVVAATVAGGHPGTIVHVMAALAIYVIVRLAASAPLPRRERLHRLGLVMVGTALGVLLLAVVLLPAAKLVPHSTALATRLGGGGWIENSGLRTLLFPDWWGRPSGINQLALPNFNERTLYIGTVALVFAVVGLTGGEWRRKLPFLAIAAFGFLVAFRTPLRTIVIELPGFDRVNDARIHLLLGFGLTVLAAFGVQALIERPSAVRRAVATLAGGVAIAVLATISLKPTWLDLKVTLKHFRTGADFPQLPRTVPLTSIGWFLLVAAGVLAVVLLARRTGRMKLAAAALAGLAAFDMVHFAGRYQPVIPARYAEPPRTPLIAFLVRNRRNGRMVGLGATLAADWPMTYGLRDVRGDDPPDPDLRYFRLWLVANPTQSYYSADLYLPQLTPAGLKVLSLLGARYIAAPRGSPPPASMRDLSPAYRGGDGIVWENLSAAPRAFVARSITPVAGERELIATIVRPDFDPRHSVVLERGQLRRVGPLSGASGTAAVRSERNATVTLRARMASAGLVVLSDRWTKGWTVQVDGHAAPSLRVNDVMRGVRVPAGSHRITWRYRAPGLILGAVLSALSLLAIIGTLVVVRLRQRGRRSAVRSAHGGARVGRTRGSSST